MGHSSVWVLQVRVYIRVRLEDDGIHVMQT